MENGGVTRPDDSTMLWQIIEATPNAMLVIDTAGDILLVNSETERTYGYSRVDLLSMNVLDLAPERLRGSLRRFLSQFFERPARHHMDAERGLFGRRQDGTEFPIEVGVNPIRILDDPLMLASVVDISERLRVQALDAARHADRLRQSILDSLPFSIIASDHDGTIVTANPAAERLLGFERGELIGSRVEALRGEVSDELSLLSTVDPHVEEREIDYNRKDGSTVPVNEAIAVMDGDHVNGSLSVAYDITERRAAEAHVLHMAHYDALTDLPNRTLFIERLEIELCAAERTQQGVVVALIGLDHFTRVNDALGHHVGDDLLIMIAARLRAHVRTRDVVARLDGDKFALMMTGIDGPLQAQDRLAAMLTAISEPLVSQGHEVVVTASMGLAISPGDGVTPWYLLKHADTAMYHAKSAGRSAYRWFNDSMLDEINDRLALAAALRGALDRGEISVSYQPQVRLCDDEVIGVEALARWRTPEGVAISPDRFIPVAEDNGLIVRLGEAVLRTACKDAVTMSDHTGIPLRLAVNVSPRQFHDRGWLDALQGALADSGLPADRLELEITEGIFMEDLHGVADVMHKMRSLGVAIVVDDFGTGFSSLSYLTRFTVDKLKIDRSFVSNLATGGTDAAIVDTIIVMAHTLGMTVVAEGVETAEQERYLSEHGCDIAQGFRYSPAVPPLDLMSQYL